MQHITLYPTDTVYGLGVDATNPEALQALTELKGRHEGKYYPIIVSDEEMAKQYVVFTPLARRLAREFWPGKLTLVLEAQNLPRELLAPDGSVGIRIPDHEVALSLVRASGRPLTATSANVSGMPTRNTVPEILTQFGERATDIIYDIAWPKELPPSKPSTVVDARGEKPVIIREGAISALAIHKATG